MLSESVIVVIAISGSDAIDDTLDAVCSVVVWITVFVLSVTFSIGLRELVVLLISCVGGFMTQCVNDFNQVTHTIVLVERGATGLVSGADFTTSNIISRAAVGAIGVAGFNKAVA